MTLPESSTPGPEPIITSLTCSTPRPSRLSRRRNLTQGQLRSLSSPLVSIPPPPPSLTEEIALPVKQTSADQCAKQQPSVFTSTLEIHPCPLSPPLVPPADRVPTTTGEEPNIISFHLFSLTLPFLPPPLLSLSPITSPLSI